MDASATRPVGNSCGEGLRLAVERLFTHGEIPDLHALVPSTLRAAVGGTPKQIGIAVRDMEQAKAQLAALGVGPFMPLALRSDSWADVEGNTQFVGEGALFRAESGVEIELIASKLYAAVLGDRSHAYHHVGFLSHDLEEAERSMSAAGYAWSSTGKYGAAGVSAQVKFFDTRAFIDGYTEALDWRFLGIPFALPDAGVRIAARVANWF